MVGTPTLAQPDAAVKESLAFIAFCSICRPRDTMDQLLQLVREGSAMGHGLLRGSQER